MLSLSFAGAHNAFVRHDSTDALSPFEIGLVIRPGLLKREVLTMKKALLYIAIISKHLETI